MNVFKSVLLVVVSAVVVIVGANLTAVLGIAQTKPTFQISDRVSYIPIDREASFRVLPAGEVHITANRAVDEAARKFGVDSSAIDPGTGVVRAVFSKANDPGHQNIPALVVVANVDMPNPNPRLHTAFRKLVTIVDASTGAAVLAYGADEEPGS